MSSKPCFKNALNIKKRGTGKLSAKIGKYEKWGARAPFEIIFKFCGRLFSVVFVFFHMIALILNTI